MNFSPSRKIDHFLAMNLLSFFTNFERSYLSHFSTVFREIHTDGQSLCLVDMVKIWRFCVVPLRRYRDRKMDENIKSDRREFTSVFSRRRKKYYHVISATKKIIPWMENWRNLFFDVEKKITINLDVENNIKFLLRLTQPASLDMAKPCMQACTENIT